MCFNDQAAAFGNLARAVHPGGRLATVAWRGPEPNEWLRTVLGSGIWVITAILGG